MEYEGAHIGVAGYAELLVRLTAARGAAYRIDLAFTLPGADTAIEPGSGEAQFDFDELADVVNDIEDYGEILTRSLFRDPMIKAGFDRACTAAEVLQAPLRVRIQIDASARELHALRWETLQDAHGGNLATSERILLSRYLRSPDWRTTRRQPESLLRALVVIANPGNLDAFPSNDAAPRELDVEAELRCALDALGDIAVTVVATRGGATLDAMMQHLRRGYDIVYVVCHGAMYRGEAHLYLENELGDVAVVTGADLVRELKQMRQLPNLVVLASCQSGGNGSPGALAAIGPLLADAGVPSVLAMQGSVSVETARQFMGRLFVELRLDGQIDRAVAVARASIKAQADAWMPVLITRSSSGRLWRTQPEPTETRFTSWDGLLNRIDEGRCTPILGPGLIEFLLGSPRQVAQRWADQSRFPMAPHQRHDLPQVAQYLEVNGGDHELPHSQLENYLLDEMRERYGDQLPASFQHASLSDLIHEVWRRRAQQDPLEPHSVLARLPLPIYISTNPDDLLSQALGAAGRVPRVELCPWNEEMQNARPKRRRDEGPTVERPLVYHLFGQMSQRKSLVLTEDNYFDYLIGVTRDRHAIPIAVESALSDSALLFLGFQIDDWNFRILFRSLMGQEGRFRRKKMPHVAVQIDPDEGSSINPMQARRYLERYFDDAHVNIYWGTTEEFIRELSAQWERHLANKRPVVAASAGARW